MCGVSVVAPLSLFLRISDSLYRDSIQHPVPPIQSALATPPGGKDRGRERERGRKVRERTYIRCKRKEKKKRERVKQEEGEKVQYMYIYNN